MGEYILEAEEVTKKFPGVIALDNVNFGVKKREILGLIGENGAGKSTLLKILNGWYPDDSFEGQLKVNDKEVDFKSPHDAHLKGIGYVPQEINILENLTVAENIFVGNLSEGNLVNFNQVNAKTEEFLQKHNIVLNPEVEAKKLSIGQKQILMVARVLSRKPEVLILDEPTSSLTLNEVDNLFKILEGLKDKGTSIIFVTHKIEEILELTDRVEVLRDGHNVSCYEREAFDEEKIVTDMVGRKINNLYPEREVEIGEEVLRVEDLTVEHPKILNRNLIEDVNFSLKKGEVLGIAGLIGAGRTELLSTLCGRMQYKRGKIYLKGKEIEIKSEKDSIQYGFSMVTEDRKKDGLMFMTNIKRNICVNSLKKISNLGMLNPEKEQERANKFFEMMDIKAQDVEESVVSLSGGNQQKVVMGRALNAEPEIMLLDEPTKGIDVGSKNDIYNIINNLVKEGISVIMVSSELPELLAMCDRFLVMAEGKIVDKFNKVEVSEEKIMLAATKGRGQETVI